MEFVRFEVESGSAAIDSDLLASDGSLDGSASRRRGAGRVAGVRRVGSLCDSAASRPVKESEIYAEGVSSLSPGLRGTRYPGSTSRNIFYRQAVASILAG